MNHCARNLLAALLGVVLFAGQAGAQPPWLDRPIAQPYTDAPWYARFNTCAWGQPVWSCDPAEDPCQTACAAPAHRFCDWYASATVAPLFYDGFSRPAVARAGINGPVRLSMNDAETEFAPAGKYTVGKALSECFRVDATYMGNYHWSADAAARNRDTNTLGGTGNLTSILSNFGDPTALPNLDFNDLATLRLATNLVSGELNGRILFDLPPGALDMWGVIGARYMDVTENLNFFTSSTTTGATNDLDIHANNQLWGVQVGLQSKYLVTTYWWLDTDLKGGIAANSFDTRRTYSPTLAGVAGGPFVQTGTDNKTAFFGDMSLTGNLQIFDNLAITAGYQVLCISGLALAERQIPNNAAFLTPGPYVPDHAGVTIYHGPMLGLTWAR